jgi:hypothetical protein
MPARIGHAHAHSTKYKRKVAPLTILPWNRVTPRSAPRWRTKPYQGIVASPCVAQHRPNPIHPNGRAYDHTHHDMGTTTRSQFLHSDQILCPRSNPRRLGQWDIDPRSRQLAMGQPLSPYSDITTSPRRSGMSGRRSRRQQVGHTRRGSW